MKFNEWWFEFYASHEICLTATPRMIAVVGWNAAIATVVRSLRARGETDLARKMNALRSLTHEIRRMVEQEQSRS